MAPISVADGAPVAVTGASGYIGAWAVYAFVRRGYTVHACVRDTSDPARTEHLLAMNGVGAPSLHTGRSLEPGKVILHTGDVMIPGSYDKAFAGCSAVIHVGTPMGYGGANDYRQIFTGAVEGTENVLASVKKSGTVKRFVYTSSFAAVACPPTPAFPRREGYMYSEKDFASDGHEDDPLWNFDENGNVIAPTAESWDTIGKVGDLSYSMAKVMTEHLTTRIAAESDQFDAMAVLPAVVLGPCMAAVHELPGSWQWAMSRMLEGTPCPRGHDRAWNVTDVRDCGEIHALIAESSNTRNGQRYLCCAADDSGLLNIFQLQAKLRRLFPDIEVGGSPVPVDSIPDQPRSHCALAQRELGLRTHHIDDTLRATGDTMLKLGMIPKVAWKPATDTAWL